MDLSENEDEVPRRKRRRAAAQVVNYAKLRFVYKNEPAFECPDCQMSFDSRRGLSAHNMHRHKDRRTPQKPQNRISNNRRQKRRRVYSAEEEDEEEEDAEEVDEEEELEDEEEDFSPPPRKKRLRRERSSSPPIEDLIKPKTVKNASKPKKVVGSLVGMEQEADDEAEAVSAEEADDAESEEQEQEEVENFPCKLCKEDRIFLTSFGLERHTKISHSDKLEEVLEDIKRLQMEKVKKAETVKSVRGQMASGFVRSQNGSRPKGSFSAFFENKELERRRKAAGKSSRRFGSAFDKEKENDPDYDPSDPNSGAVIQMVRQQRAAIVASASFTEPKMTGGRHKKSLDAPKAKYQSCDICGILINTEHPRAMESHTKAHQKNQELRDELMRLYGPSWVDNVTCKECNLVFKDDEKLEQHRRNVHVRRRHFLCRFCGDVFRNMRDLNLHKERRHEAFEGHRRHTYESVDPAAGGQGGDFYVNDSSNRSAALPPSIGADQSTVSDSAGGPAGSSSAFNSTSRPSSRSQNSVADAGNAEEFSCRTVCEVCGLQMVRPSNLIRHMKQAHDRTNFTATVETKGMPPFRIDVFQGQFMWGCCDEIYDDRQAFISHRRSAHGPQSHSGVLRECEHCGLVFNNNLLYVNHLRTHRPRICYICGESFGSSVDADNYKAHMMKHKEQGYNINLCQINDDWLRIRKESERVDSSESRFAVPVDQADADLLDDFAVPDDQCSVFSESGVESECDDAQSQCDEKDDAKLFTLCAVCDKRFDCVYRFGEHWSLHCVKPLFSLMTFKTKPFSFKKHFLKRFYCSICPSKFYSRVSLALHFLNCQQRKLLGPTVKKQPENKAKEQTVETRSNFNSESFLTAEDRTSPLLVSVADSATYESAIRRCDDSHELEDCLDFKQNKRYNNYVEKAYIVEWDTNKIAPDFNPYLCCTCHRSFGDFLGLIAHVKTHVEHPIYAKIEENASVVTSKNGTPFEKNAAQKENEVAESSSSEPVRAFVLSIKTGASLIGTSKFSCSICSKKFDDKSLFNEHLHLNHKNRKRHSCDACGKRFWTRSGLKMHAQVHDESKHYCNICEKKFINAEALSRHQTVHELVNSVYQCEDCVQSLYGLSQLKAHFVKRHPGIRIVTCSVCARIHTDAEGVEEHFNAEHPRTRIFCAICMKSFKTPMKCKRHVKRAHRKCLPRGNK